MKDKEVDETYAFQKALWVLPSAWVLRMICIRAMGTFTNLRLWTAPKLGDAKLDNWVNRLSWQESSSSEIHTSDTPISRKV